MILSVHGKSAGQAAPYRGTGHMKRREFITLLGGASSRGIAFGPIPARAEVQDIKSARSSQRVCFAPASKTWFSAADREMRAVGRTCGRRACELPALNGRIATKYEGESSGLTLTLASRV